MPQRTSDELHTSVQARSKELIDLRRHFHQHPEIAYEEYQTAKDIASHLRESGLEVEEGIADTGVVALLRGEADAAGNGANRTLLVRADIDGLPVSEETGLDYASRVPGKMHACGHDAHVAIALTTAKVLAMRRDRLHGNVKFVFQPAEERIGGAGRMIEAGVMRILTSAPSSACISGV